MATYVRTQTIEHEIGDDGRIAVRTTSSDTRIHATDGPVARIRATFEISADSEADADRIFAECQLRISRGSGSLEAEEPKNLPNALLGAVGRLLGRSGHIEAEIEVEAPRGCELRYEGVSADVTSDGLRGNQRYATVSGDLLLTDVGGELRINGVSADVTIRGVDPLTLRSNGVSGDLSVMAPRFVALQANTVSGDLEIEGAFEPRGEHRLETVSGDATIGLVGGATFEVRGMATDVSCRLPHELSGQADRRRVIVGDGAARITFSSMSGDLSITWPRRISAEAPAGAPASAGESSEATEQLDVLRALERGEIDVEEASRRLAEAADR